MIQRSRKLDKVRYDIRGPIYRKSREIVAQGGQLLQLNIGNPAPYGFNASRTIIESISSRINEAQGYVDSNGLEEARIAIAQEMARKGIEKVTMQDVYVGNGVSELISITLQALINSGDEVLVPAPDYPLWTSTIGLCGGTPIHYHCDESEDWLPSLQDIRQKKSTKTKAIVLINPNNPTGAVYPRPFLEKLVAMARENGWLVLSDEIYDRVLFDDVQHIATASIDDSVPCITFGGLSKNYMATGFRAGWMAISGKAKFDSDFFMGIDTLMSMRLCSNALAQLAIKPALEGEQEIESLVLPTGRLKQQRDTAHKLLNDIPGISCKQAKGALYLFPKIDLQHFNADTDVDFVYRLLEEKHVLVVQGTGFNWPKHDHFRITFLPSVEILHNSLQSIAELATTQTIPV